MGNGNAKPSGNGPNNNYFPPEPEMARTDAGRLSQRKLANERRKTPSSPRMSPRRSASARQDSPAAAVPSLSRESTVSLGQRIARHAKQQEALDGSEYADEFTDRIKDPKFQRKAEVAGRFPEDELPPEDMEPEDMEPEDWQPQYGGQYRRQREVFRRDPTSRRRKEVTFSPFTDVHPGNDELEDPGLTLPPLVNNIRPANGNKFSADQLHTPSVSRIPRLTEERKLRTAVEAEVPNELMNGHLRTRLTRPQNPSKAQSTNWFMDDDNTSNYSSSTASLASRPSRFPQRTAASRRPSVLPPLDSNDIPHPLSSNGQPRSARPIRRQILSMDSIPAETNFYHLYHHGMPKKSKRNQPRQ